MKKLSIQELHNCIKEIDNGTYEFSGTEDAYQNTKSSITLTHLTCGHSFKVIFGNFYYNKARCPYCRTTGSGKRPDEYYYEDFQNSVASNNYDFLALDRAALPGRVCYRIKCKYCSKEEIIESSLVKNRECQCRKIKKKNDAIFKEFYQVCEEGYKLINIHRGISERCPVLEIYCPHCHKNYTTLSVDFFTRGFRKCRCQNIFKKKTEEEWGEFFNTKYMDDNYEFIGIDKDIVDNKYYTIYLKYKCLECGKISSMSTSNLFHKPCTPCKCRTEKMYIKKWETEFYNKADRAKYKFLRVYNTYSVTDNRGRGHIEFLYLPTEQKYDISIDYFTASFTNNYVENLDRREQGHGTGVSHYEYDIIKLLEKFYPNKIIHGSFNIIPPRQIDIYLPDIKVGIEFNGDYWHSDEQILARTGMLSEEYDNLKRADCNSRGIKLYFIKEHEWNELNEEEKFNILKLMINKEYNN